MAVKQTSKAALDQLVLNGTCRTQAQKVYEYLTYNSSTRKEIAEDLGMELSAVCGRCNTLVMAGVVVVSKIRACSISGKQVEELKAKE